MPGGVLHDCRDHLYVFVWYLFVKEITHRIHEDHPRLAPANRVEQFFGNQPNIETLFVGMTRNAAKALSEDFCIAMRTAWTELAAASYWIPSSVGPFDLGT